MPLRDQDARFAIGLDLLFVDAARQHVALIRRQEEQQLAMLGEQLRWASLPPPASCAPCARNWASRAPTGTCTASACAPGGSAASSAWTARPGTPASWGQLPWPRAPRSSPSSSSSRPTCPSSCASPAPAPPAASWAWRCSP
ncbi:hypothetical protein [Thermogemmatispora tikiterensis]|uniref:hypothetical protein n=1 Tax=Thermogemmatispora tikiterensis TaxID=1825093 RepID=UPI0011BF2585|nr:hypothetical protein [Thermogemmatispora tikiterensis]